MEIKKEYVILFNSISDAIDEVEDIVYRGKKLLRKLKIAQQQSEEISIIEENESEA